MRFHPRRLVGIRSDFCQIDNVRPREQIGRLKEVDVRVEVARQNEFTFAINSARVLWQIHRCLIAESADPIVLDQHSAAGHYDFRCRIDQSPVNERDLFRARCQRQQRN